MTPKLPEGDASSGLTWQNYSGWVTLYHHPRDGYWVEPDMAQGSPVGLTHGQAVAWIAQHYPQSQPIGARKNPRRNPAGRAHAVSGRIWDVEVEGKPVAQVLAADAPGARAQVDVRPGRLAALKNPGRKNPRYYNDETPEDEARARRLKAISDLAMQAPKNNPITRGHFNINIDNGYILIPEREAKALNGGKLPPAGYQVVVEYLGKNHWLQRTVHQGKSRWSLYPVDYGRVAPLKNPDGPRGLGPGKRLLAKGGTRKRRFHDQAIGPQDFEKTSMTYGTLPSAEAFAKHFEVVCPDGVFRVGNDPLYGNHTFGLAGLWDAVEKNTAKFTDDGNDAAGDWVSCVMTTLGFEWV